MSLRYVHDDHGHLHLGLLHCADWLLPLIWLAGTWVTPSIMARYIGDSRRVSILAAKRACKVLTRGWTEPSICLVDSLSSPNRWMGDGREHPRNGQQFVRISRTPQPSCCGGRRHGMTWDDMVKASQFLKELDLHIGSKVTARPGCQCSSRSQT